MLVNAAACQFYGWSGDELLAKPLRDPRPPEDLARFEHARPRTRASGADVRARQPAPHRDRRAVAVAVEMSWLELRGRPATLAVITDLTAAAEAET